MERSSRIALAGFTLLELLIVLAIMAGLVAIAVPQFSQLYSRVRASFERADLERQLFELPQLVRQRGRGGVLLDPTQEPAPGTAAAAIEPPGSSGFEQWEMLRINLPPGWAMRVPKPVFYRFTGACSGGEVDFSLPPSLLRYNLIPPLCRPRLAEANAPQ
jgi:prepilin-type N-terminal cleavage/methylation domain-containing protein